MTFQRIKGVPGDLRDMPSGLRYPLEVSGVLNGVSRGFSEIPEYLWGILEGPTEFKRVQYIPRVSGDPSKFQGASGISRVPGGLRSVPKCLSIILEGVRCVLGALWLIQSASAAF